MRVRAYGLDLRLPRRSGSLSNLAYFGECFEWSSINFLRAYLRPGDRVLDVGANVGMFTYAAVQIVGTTGAVQAVEPLPWAKAALVENVTANGLGDVVTVFGVAVSDVPGEVEFVDDLDVSSHISFSSGNNVGRSRTKLVCEPLDGFAAYGLALAKIDVEGAEAKALAGFVDHLNSGDPPVLILEAHDHSLKKMGSSRAAVLGTLREFGYEPHTFDPSMGVIAPLTSDDWSDDAIFIHMAQYPLIEQRLGRAGEPS